MFRNVIMTIFELSPNPDTFLQTDDYTKKFRRPFQIHLLCEIHKKVTQKFLTLKEHDDILNKR